MTTFPAVMRAAGWQLVKVADGFRWYKNRVYIKHGLTLAFWVSMASCRPGAERRMKRCITVKMLSTN